MKKRIKYSEKQIEAWGLLLDNKTTELFFGGGAGGGKSRLGCMFAIHTCLKYQGVRGLIGRKKLKRLKETTLKTFWEVCKDWGLRAGVHYNYNAQDGVIKFFNESEILLADLAHQPSDPEYDELGSLELTFAFVDEAPQISFKCWSVLNSRIRFKLDEYGLIPKCFGTGNPTKKWPYTEFYNAKRQGKLDAGKEFVQSLAKDNPFISIHYIRQLQKIKDKATRERLLNGNWEYDDDPSVLFSYEAILDLFTNEVEDDKSLWISGDVSRKGRDKMPIGLWRGLKLLKVFIIPPEIRQSTKKSAEYIMEKARYYGVRFSRIILDEDGIGGGVIDNIPQCKGFLNNGSPILSRREEVKKKKGEYFANFGNLKAQCYFKLEELMDEGKIAIAEDAFDSVDDKEAFIEEMGQIKQRDIDKDSKIYIIDKKDIKANIGRSPDFADMIMMRMYFELKPKSGIRVTSI
jgi:hypothetical protein